MRFSFGRAFSSRHVLCWGSEGAGERTGGSLWAFLCIVLAARTTCLWAIIVRASWLCLRSVLQRRGSKRLNILPFVNPSLCRTLGVFKEGNWLSEFRWWAL